MFVATVKILTFLIIFVNSVFIPKLPQIQITVPYSSPLSSFLSLFYSPPLLDACTPDFSQGLDVNVTNVPIAFETCVEEMSQLPENPHPDLDKGTAEVIQSYGYPLEVHKVVTEDGYILTLHRIPRHGKLPIYLQHGLAGCSDNWILQYQNQSLAFLLADHGYDIWLGNARGSSYSLEHEFLHWDNPFNYSYWEFSWDDIGRYAERLEKIQVKYDVPAIISHIISASGQPKIIFIGHSMGTTTYFVGLDQVPELNNKILAGILLAPTGFISRSPSPLRAIAELIGNNPDYLEPIFKGRVDLRHKDQILGALNMATFADICTPTAVRCTTCDEFIFALYGMDAPEMNYTNIPNILSKYPNIMSVKTALHYAQSIIHCTFRQFDYGMEKNLQVYDSPVPPEYTLKNITVPTYSFHAEFDNLCRPKDVERTLNLLPPGTLKANIRVNSTYFNHIDFVIAKNAIELLVYTQILSILADISH